MRLTPELTGETLRILPPGTIVEIVESVQGEQVSQNGITSDEWLHVIADGEVGYVWGPLIGEVGTVPLIGSGCDDITAIQGMADTTDDMTMLYGLRGQPLVWLGYPEPGETPQWGVLHGTDPMPYGQDAIATFAAYTPTGGPVYYIVFFRSTDGRYSAWVVEAEQTAASDGRHMGNHPPEGCQPLLLQGDDVERFLASLR